MMVLYADPPWRYEYSRAKNRDIENHYNTMTLEEIKRMKIPTEKDTVLFLWATAPKLTEALEVLAAWGFTYRTCAIWDKQVMGMGHWFRIQHEILLVGIKGSPKTPPPSKRISSILNCKRSKHSEKPFVVRDTLKAMYPDAQCVEMFARTSWLGWESIGDQVDKMVFQ